MNTTRWLMVAALGMLGCTWARASTLLPPPPDSFEITLTGFLPGETFDVTTSSTSLTETQEGAFQNPFCPDGEEGVCDPEARLTVPADATTFDGSATLTANGNGTVEMGFLNVGPNIETFLITTSITEEQQGEGYMCTTTDSGDEFNFCGFSDPNKTLTIAFSDPKNAGGIATAVPEPTQYALLLIAFGGVIVARRIRSQRAPA